MPDEKQFEQWVGSLSEQEIIQIYFGQPIWNTVFSASWDSGDENGLKVYTLDILDALLSEGKDALVPVEKLLRIAARDDLRRYFDNHKSECLERIEPRENGLSAEQRNPSLTLKETVKEWNRG